jgi:hypothetical protein
MPLDNLISIKFTDLEKSDISAAMTVIEDIINPKVLNLTPKQRQEYGRLGDETENFVVKTIDYTQQKPEIVPFFLEADELKIDIEAREAVGPILKRLSIITEKLEDTHKVVGFDLYNSVIAIYRNVKMLSKQNVPGITVIYEDLKKQFPHVVLPVIDFEADPELDDTVNDTTTPV